MKKRHRFIHATALIASSIATIVPATPAKASQTRDTKKARIAVPGEIGDPTATGSCDPPDLTAMLKRMADALANFIPVINPFEQDQRAPFTTGEPVAIDLGPVLEAEQISPQRYPWRERIVTTTFWIGEKPTPANPVPNHISSWDKDWAKNYGGTDNPDPKRRHNYHPDDFIPKLNPFYIALPYNDLITTGHKPEAEKIIPWFKAEFKGRGISVLKDRWIAIRHKDRTVYAQWQDCGPFRTDHAEYVFGNARPSPNINKGAGLDVSPAVRDYLGMKDTDLTDWRFVELDEVPNGPWKTYGENNHFVHQRRANERKLALEKQIRPSGS